MPTYEYRCAQDGHFDVSQPLGEATSFAHCPACGDPAARVFTAPMLSRAPRSVRQVIDRAERTRETPDVVTSIPPRRTPAPAPAVARNPALRRLPRP